MRPSSMREERAGAFWCHISDIEASKVTSSNEYSAFATVFRSVAVFSCEVLCVCSTLHFQFGISLQKLQC